MGTDDNREIDDQLNVLFDDLFDEEEDAKKAEEAEGAAEAVKDAAAEVQAPAEKAAETVVNAVEAAEEIPAAAAEKTAEAVTATEGLVDDSGLENEARSLDFNDLDPELFEDEDEAAVYEAPAEKPQEETFEAEEEDIIPVKDKTGKLPAFEEEDTEDQEREADEEEADDYDVRTPRRKERGSQPTAEQLKKEYRHFWIFTAIVALVVAVAVLAILYFRGIIGFGNKETKAPETTTTPAQTEITTKETEPTTTEPTTEPTTESETETESESESESESTTEEETTEPTTEDPRRAVLDNYENVFIANANTLNIRKEASTSSAVIGTMKMNDAGSILEMQGDWAHITSGGVDGYVAAEFIKTGEEAEKYAVENAKEGVRIEADTVNVRAGASTDTNIVGKAKKGETYDLIDQDSEGFYHIRFEDKEAYVSSEFCTLSWFLKEAKAE